MGVTFLFSSGDSGVAGNGICLDSNGYEDPYGEVFNPTFPGTCPYITSVGATQIQSGASVCTCRLHRTAADMASLSLHVRLGRFMTQRPRARRKSTQAEGSQTCSRSPFIRRGRLRTTLPNILLLMLLIFSTLPAVLTRTLLQTGALIIPTNMVRTLT